MQERPFEALVDLGRAHPAGNCSTDQGAEADAGHAVEAQTLLAQLCEYPDVSKRPGTAAGEDDPERPPGDAPRRRSHCLAQPGGATDDLRLARFE